MRRSRTTAVEGSMAPTSTFLPSPTPLSPCSGPTPTDRRTMVWQMVASAASFLTSPPTPRAARFPAEACVGGTWALTMGWPSTCSSPSAHNRHTTRTRWQSNTGTRSRASPRRPSTPRPASRASALPSDLPSARLVRHWMRQRRAAATARRRSCERRSSTSRLSRRAHRRRCRRLAGRTCRSTTSTATW